MGVQARVFHDQRFETWMTGFNEMGDIDGEAMEIWEQATEYFFGRTQEFAHILTGDMKSTGRYEMFAGNMTVTGQVEYGDTEVDYTVYELARGGDHDFYQLAMDVSEQEFQEAFERAVKASIMNKVS